MIRVLRPDGRIVISEPDWSTLVIHPFDKAISEYLIKSVTNYFIGRELYSLFKLKKLDHVDVEIDVIKFTDFTKANEALGLKTKLKRLLNLGKISEGLINDWQNSMLMANDRGLFFSSINIYIVKGVKSA